VLIGVAESQHIAPHPDQVFHGGASRRGYAPSFVLVATSGHTRSLQSESDVASSLMQAAHRSRTASSSNPAAFRLTVPPSRSSGVRPCSSTGGLSITNRSTSAPVGQTDTDARVTCEAASVIPPLSWAGR